jgi:hypothetical protein
MTMNEITELEASSGVDDPVEVLVMPCPRLEFRWHKTGDTWYSRECSYSLVLPLGELDIRHTDAEGNPTELTLEIGRTFASGGKGEPPVFDGKVDTPFRDFAHAMWDRKALGNHLPVVAVCGDAANLVDIPPEYA